MWACYTSAAVAVTASAACEEQAVPTYMQPLPFWLKPFRVGIPGNGLTLPYFPEGVPLVSNPRRSYILLRQHGKGQTLAQRAQ